MVDDKMRKIALAAFIGSVFILLALMILGFPGYIYAFPLHAAFISVSIYLLYKNDFKTLLKELGVPYPAKRLLAYALAGTIGSLIIGMLIQSVLFSIGIRDMWKVSEKVLEAPRLLVMLLFIIPPISEELLFRGVLMNRFGVFISTFIFALGHFFYGSIANIIGAFFIGLLYAYIYKKTGSLLPGIAAHAGYNFIAVLLVLNSG